MPLALGIGLGLPFGNPAGDSTPGGAASVLLAEDGDGLLAEDGTYIILDE